MWRKRSARSDHTESEQDSEDMAAGKMVKIEWAVGISRMRWLMGVEKGRARNLSGIPLKLRALHEH
jgi:hypothetical protein